MARVKTTTDREIVEAAARVIARVGAVSLRLSDVSAEVGLAPATLLQRFKTKQDLLLAVTALRTEEIVEDFARRRATASSPLEALLFIGPEKRCFINSRQQLANSLASIQLSLTDAGFHRQMDLLARTLRRELTSLIEEAVAAGELRGCQPDLLARAVMAIFHGSLIWWAVGREGAAEAHLQQDLETLLGPYRTTSDSTSPHPRRTASDPSFAPPSELPPDPPWSA
jgi:AcrR family transcriptional regulator